MLALGQMVVILTRCIDLSVAANLALHRHGRRPCSTPAHPGIPIAAADRARASRSALALGAINGLLVWQLGIPPIVVTLGTLTIYRGIDLRALRRRLGQCRTR